MPFKLMRFSSNVLAGNGLVKSLPDHLTSLGMPPSAIVLCGEKAYRVAGKAAVTAVERSFGVERVEAAHEPSFREADILYRAISSKGVDGKFILAIGGGVTIDTAKHVAQKLHVPLVVIPTLLSSNAIASGFSVLWKDGKSNAIPTMVPTAVIGDYDILKNQPRRYVSAGAGDMLSKCSALYDWRLGFWLGGESYNDFAMNVAQSTTDLLKRRISDVSSMNYIGIETLFLAEITDGYLMELSGTTRVAAGSEHLFTFAVEPKSHGALHGELCGLGTIMMHYLQTRDREEVRKLLESAGAPTTAKQLGIPPKEIVKALTVAHRTRKWYTILGNTGLSEGAAERLAKYSGVI